MILVPRFDIVAVDSKISELCSIVKIDFFLAAVVGKNQHVVLFCFWAFHQWNRFFIDTQPEVGGIIHHT